MSFRGFYFAVVMSVLLAAGSARAQGVVQQAAPFSSPPNPVGSGARAIGWGNAFIAVADDATAASWNPAGLIQLTRPEISTAGSYHSRSEDLEFSGLDAGSDSMASSAMNLNYASVVYPFHLGDVNFVAALNYQRFYEFDRDLSYHAAGTLGGGTTFSENRKLEQFGAITAYTPALAVQLLPSLSLGVAVNIYGLDPANDGWEQRWVQNGTVTNASGIVIRRSWSETREEYELTGSNYVIGLHYKLQAFTFAAVYKSGWEADVKYRRSFEQAAVFPLSAVSNYHQAYDYRDDQTMVWPESWGVGVAWRYSDNLSFAVDGFNTRWSQYKLKTDAGDVNLLAVNDPGADVTDDAWQIHGGFEYLWIRPRYVIALRAGGFYDPQPIEDRVNDFYGAAVGAGLAYDQLIVDAAFQYRWANDVEGETIENVTSTSDVSDYYAVVSVIYHF